MGVKLLSPSADRHHHDPHNANSSFGPSAIHGSFSFKKVKRKRPLLQLTHERYHVKKPKRNKIQILTRSAQTRGLNKCLSLTVTRDQAKKALHREVIRNENKLYKLCGSIETYKTLLLETESGQHSCPLCKAAVDSTILAQKLRTQITCISEWISQGDLNQRNKHMVDQLETVPQAVKHRMNFFEAVLATSLPTCNSGSTGSRDTLLCMKKKLILESKCGICGTKVEEERGRKVLSEIDLRITCLQLQQRPWSL